MDREVDSRAVEPIAVTYQVNGVGVTGATLRYDVTRIVGGSLQILNRTTATFVAPPVADGDRYRTLAQVDAAVQPGEYADSTGLDLDAITNPTIPDPWTPLVYRVGVYQTAPDVRDLGAADLFAGVTDTIRRRTTNREELAVNGTLTSYRNDNATAEVTSQIRDKDGNLPTLNAGDPARRSGET